MGQLGQSDKEGEAERRRELEEEEMAQAGQPEKLEEDLDQPQQEEEEEPEPQQPDENAVDRERGRSQQVRYLWALWTETRTSKKRAQLVCDGTEGVCLKRPLLVKYNSIPWVKHVDTIFLKSTVANRAAAFPFLFKPVKTKTKSLPGIHFDFSSLQPSPPWRSSISRTPQWNTWSRPLTNALKLNGPKSVGVSNWGRRPCSYRERGSRGWRRSSSTQMPTERSSKGRCPDHRFEWNVVRSWFSNPFKTCLPYDAGTRRRTAYETMDTDIVQGEEGHHTDDEGETSAAHSTFFYRAAATVKTVCRHVTETLMVGRVSRDQTEMHTCWMRRRRKRWRWSRKPRHINRWCSHVHTYTSTHTPIPTDKLLPWDLPSPGRHRWWAGPWGRPQQPGRRWVWWGRGWAAAAQGHWGGGGWRGARSSRPAQRHTPPPWATSTGCGGGTGGEWITQMSPAGPPVKNKDQSWKKDVNFLFVISRWLETQTKRKIRWMTSTRRTWRMRCVTWVFFRYQRDVCPPERQVYCLLVSTLVKAQEDVAGGHKKDVMEEDPYNEDNMEQVSFQQNHNQNQFICWCSDFFWSHWQPSSLCWNPPSQHVRVSNQEPVRQDLLNPCVGTYSKRMLSYLL